MAAGDDPAAAARPPADDFEAQHMSASGTPLHREKQKAKWHWALLLAMLVTGGLAVGFASSGIPALYLAAAIQGAVAALLGFLWLTMTVLRVLVTDAEVVVRYGLWGPSIALEDIEEIEVVDYDFANYGGWGLRKGGDGTLGYVLSGGKLVRLTYRDKGVSKRLALSSENAGALAAAIERACAAKSTYRGRALRVKVTADDDHDRDALAEAEAAAEAETGARASDARRAR